MKKTNLYEAIFKRKSIRKYDVTPLDENTLTEVLEYIGAIKPMYDNVKTEMKLISQNEVKGLMAIKAPHYIVVSSEKKKGYLTNAGFMLQQMDLFLSANGIGSCWLGMAKPTKKVFINSELEFVIVLAIGRAIEPLYRENIMEFKRKPLAQISNITGMDQLLKPAGLAPSGTNNQPWFFTGNEDAIHAYCVKTNIIKALIYERMNKIDMGIAICHLWIAAEHFGKKVDFICDKEISSNPPSGHYYVTTLKMT
ncbi:Nitroreductase [Anaerovirgula multivorans]|uniref:Nitroreductase n=1 Tax=Anaerovirgula multivorans TaxID=312168 RepID=A0A239E6U3_9FIRM|nr:nitroreductase family protein [Anaerovirgula multivorans]SNS40347.1 Nitroreductase [Anaerovirgula multivorans]